MPNIVHARELDTFDHSIHFEDPDLPLHLDLGTGLGHFTVDMALSYPKINWIAVEYEPAIAVRAARRINSSKIENAVVICADARLYLHDCCQSNQFEHIWINFPDPWPKDRHQDRRHTHPWMMGLLSDRLTPSGELHLATDVPEFLNEMKQSAKNEPLLAHPDSNWTRKKIGVQTKYERKWSQSGKTLHYFDWIVRKPDETNETYNPNFVPCPDLKALKKHPSARTIKQDQYVGKLFRPRNDSPNIIHFILIDSKTGLESTGRWCLTTGELRLAGKWMDWKVRLAEKLFT